MERQKVLNVEMKFGIEILPKNYRVSGERAFSNNSQLIILCLANPFNQKCEEERKVKHSKINSKTSTMHFLSCP